jgi:hypothetical protein
MASPLNSWKTLQEEETPVRTGRASSVEAAIWVCSTACSTSSSGSSRLVASLTIRLLEPAEAHPAARN